MPSLVGATSTTSGGASVLLKQRACDPMKLNCVVVRGFNDDDVVDLARLTLENDWDVRFIEMMPFGEITEFQQDNVVSFQEIRERVESVFGPLEETRYDYVDPSRPLPYSRRHGHARFYQQCD